MKWALVPTLKSASIRLHLPPFAFIGGFILSNPLLLRRFVHLQTAMSIWLWNGILPTPLFSCGPIANNEPK